MKICILSDTHLSSNKYAKMDHEKGLNRFLVRQFESLEWVTDYLRKNNIKTIVHSGDVFDSSKVTVYPIKRAKEILDGFDVYAIKGNHDDNNFLHENEISAIDLIGVHSINTPMAKIIDGVNFVFIPWGYEIDEKLMVDGMKNILVAHGFPKDYFNTNKMNFSPFNSHGILGNKMNFFDLVITGHYHSIDEFSYGQTKYLNPGSISSFSNDSGRHPSIWILDTKTLEYERVKIPCAVRLLRSKPEDVNDYLDTIDTEDIYRITIDSKDSIDRKRLLEARKKALDIQLKLITNENKNEDSSVEAVDEFWAYVEKNSKYKEDFLNVVSSLELES